MRHMHAVDRPICELDSPSGQIGEITRVIFGGVDCPECLRRAIADAEDRALVLHELLAKAEVSS